MNHEFCINCGKKSSFEVAKPKFCQFCGVPFNTSIGVAKSAVKQKEEEPEDSDFDISSIDVDALRRQISFEASARKTTLDDLWSAPAPRDPTRRVATQGPEGRDLLKQIEQQCAPTKYSRDIDE